MSHQELEVVSRPGASVSLMSLLKNVMAKLKQGTAQFHYVGNNYAIIREYSSVMFWLLGE